MKKKLVTILFLSMVLMFSMFAFVACGDNSGNEQPPVVNPPQQEQPNEPEPEVPVHVHSKDNATSVVVDVTCVDDGYTEYTCACGEKFKEDYVKAPGHTFSAFVSNNDATEIADGTKTATCSVCQATRTLDDVGSRLSSVNDFVFVANTTGYTVSEYVATDALNVSIPNAYNGQPVTVIGADAFKGNTDVETVVIPATVEIIEAGAFEGCKALEKVTFGGTSNWFAPAGALDLTDTAANAKALVKTYRNAELKVITDGLFYIVDSQVAGATVTLATNGKLEGAVKIAGLSNSLFADGSSAGFVNDEYPLVVKNENSIDVTLTRFLAGTNDLIGADGSVIATLTINPITDNYINVDKDASIKLEIANVGKVLFNGNDAATVAGITVDETGITFDKAVFASNMGHNKVEINAYNYTYTLSVCAVTQSQLNNPITFEDGKVSPFVGVLSGTILFDSDEDGKNDTPILYSSGLAVVDLTTHATLAATVNAKQRKYVITDGDEVVNKFALAVNSEAGVYISTYYIKARNAKLAEVGVAGDFSANEFLWAKGFRGTQTASRYATGTLENGTTCTLANGEVASFTFGGWGNDGANFGPIMNYNQYTKMMADDTIDYLYFVNPRTSASQVFTMYIDDIAATIDTSYMGDASSNYGLGNSRFKANTENNTGTDNRIKEDKVQLEA